MIFHLESFPSQKGWCGPTLTVPGAKHEGTHHPLDLFLCVCDSALMCWRDCRPLSLLSKCDFILLTGVGKQQIYTGQKQFCNNLYFSAMKTTRVQSVFCVKGNVCLVPAHFINADTV